MRRDSGGGGRGGAGGARGAGARRGGQGRRGQQPRRPAQPGKSRRRGGCGTRSSIPASRRRFTTARPRWSSVSLDLPSGGCSGQRACLHASLCLGVPLATGTHNNSTLSLSLSLSLTHRLAVHVFRRRRRRRRQQGGRTCCARARSSRRPVCWQRRACLCSGVCSRVPASWCCGPVRTPRDSPRASTSPRPPPWRRLTGSRTLPSGPSLPTAERRRTTGGRTQLLRLHPPSRGKTFWAGGRVHTPSRVPQPWGAPSCRQTDSLPCLLAGTVHWRQRSTSATATRHPWHSTSCSCRSLACRRWHRRGCAWR